MTNNSMTKIPKDCLIYMLQFMEINDAKNMLTVFNKYVANTLQNNNLIMKITNDILNIPNVSHITHDMIKIMISNYLYKNTKILRIYVCPNIYIESNEISPIIHCFMHTSYHILSEKEISWKFLKYENIKIQSLYYIILYENQLYYININITRVPDIKLYEICAVSHDNIEYGYVYLGSLFCKNIRQIFMNTHNSPSNIKEYMCMCFGAIIRSCNCYSICDCDWYWYEYGCRCYYWKFKNNYPRIIEQKFLQLAKEFSVRLYGPKISHHFNKYIRDTTSLSIISSHENNEIITHKLADRKRLKKVNSLKKKFANLHDFKIFKKMYLSDDIRYHYNPTEKTRTDINKQKNKPHKQRYPDYINDNY